MGYHYPLFLVSFRLSQPEGAVIRTGTKRKVYSFDTLLESFKPSIDDDDILDFTTRHFNKVKDQALIPSDVSNERGNIDRMKIRLKSLSTTIESERMSLDRSNQFEINRFNAMVGEFNSLKEAYNNAVDSFNESRQDRQYSIHTIVSVGGGINLRPKDFGKPLQVPESSPLIRRIRSSREVVRSSPSTVSGTTKSAVKGAGETAITKRASKPWKLVAEQSSGDLTKRRWTASNQRIVSVEANSKTGYIHHRVTTNRYFSDMTMKPGRSEVIVLTSRYPTEIVATGNFSQGGTIVLRRGKKIDGQVLQRDSSDAPQESKWVRSGQHE